MYVHTHHSILLFRWYVLYTYVFSLAGDIIGYQVYYNGTMMNVNSLTITLTFTAPSLPDGVFNGTIVVMVTAVSILGVGPPSAPVSTLITGMYIIIVIN